MNVSLNHEDIQVALKAFVKDQIKVADGVTLNINVTCGRGANATSATVDFISADSLAAGPEKAPVVETAAAKKKAAKVAAAATKAAEEEKKEEVTTEVNEEPAVIEEAEVSTTGGLFDE